MVLWQAAVKLWWSGGQLKSYGTLVSGIKVVVLWWAAVRIWCSGGWWQCYSCGQRRSYGALVGGWKVKEI